jgi:hypothetical protein
MRFGLALRFVGTVVLVAAVTVMLLQVRVGGAGSTGRSCGSSFDVIADRAGWETWYAQDGIDGATPAAVPLLRTLRCPGAVNTRTLVAGVLWAVGVVALVASGWLRRDATSASTPSCGLSARLRRLGLVVTVVGVALVAAGLVALGVLLADRQATMFIFVGRPLVALIGLVVLTPVLALVAGGRALGLLARGLEEREARDATT